MRTYSAKSTPTTKRRASMFLHGGSGAGKSTRSFTGGRPLGIVFEPKAEAQILNYNPNATAWAPESIKDLLDVFQWLGSPKLLEQGFTRIVVDSFTDLTASLPEWLVAHNTPDAAGQIARKMEIQEYNDVQGWALAVVKAVQSTGLPTIIIARSESVKQGRIERIVPMGLGKSVNKLPGLLLPTVEARIDSESGFIWDTTPDEYSQRCGLPWVPHVWNGTADDFLALVERGPAEEPKTIGDMVAAKRQADKINPSPVSPAVSDFVDSLTA